MYELSLYIRATFDNKREFSFIRFRHLMPNMSRSLPLFLPFCLLFHVFTPYLRKSSVVFHFSTYTSILGKHLKYNNFANWNQLLTKDVNKNFNFSTFISKKLYLTSHVTILIPSLFLIIKY